MAGEKQEASVIQLALGVTDDEIRVKCSSELKDLLTIQARQSRMKYPDYLRMILARSATESHNVGMS
jgi:predicted DNA binding CopG/RHH family protein